MSYSTELFDQNPRLALTEQRDRLASEELKAEAGWNEWKDNPLMKDVAAQYNRQLWAVRHTITYLNACIADL